MFGLRNLRALAAIAFAATMTLAPVAHAQEISELEGLRIKNEQLIAENECLRAGGAQRSTLLGSWSVSYRWSDNAGNQNSIATLERCGRLVFSTGEVGAWTQQGSAVTFRFVSNLNFHVIYRGTLRGDTISGTMTAEPYAGSFTATRR